MDDGMAGIKVEIINDGTRGPWVSVPWEYATLARATACVADAMEDT